MTQEQIHEGYWLIYHFMGIDYQFPPDYHLSWDALMPVVKKIEQHKFHGDDDPAIHQQDYAFMRTLHSNMARINNHSLFRAETQIEAVYMAVVDFIKQENEHKNKN